MDRRAQCHYKYKIGAIILLGNARDLSFVNIDDLFGDVKTQAYSFGIKLLTWIHEPKQLE